MSTSVSLPSIPDASAEPPAESGFKYWEKGLVVLACLLFTLSLYLYVSGFPLRRYLFDLEDEGKRIVVGTLTVKNGSLRRQLEGESEFKSLAQADTLYDDDVVVTGPDGGATIQLEDGSLLELGADTMVRLHFQSKITLGGISRAATIDVVAGTVQSRVSPTARVSRPIPIRRPPKPVELPRLAVVPKPIATAAPIVVAPPAPAPTPFVDPMRIEGVRLISPRSGTRMSLPANPARLELPVGFNWTAKPAARPVQLILWKLASGARGAARVSMFSQIVTDQAGQGRAASLIRSPGLYEWELRTAKGKMIGNGKGTTAQFVIEPEFDAIEPIDPLIGGKPMSSSRLNGDLLTNFDITLRWKPYPGASRYRVRVKTSNDPKRPALEREVVSPSYLFGRGKVFAGQFFYEIRAPLKSGFVARSAMKPFVFTFMAPSPVVPLNKTVITQENLQEESDSVLMTWEKTNFTDWYELSISTDAEFKKMVKTQRHKENFFIFKSPPSGTFYWRVRSSSKSIVSTYSPAFEFRIDP